MVLDRNVIIAALRTAFFTFLTGFITGLVGWLNDVVGWLQRSEEVPFPDPGVLKVLLFSAVAAAGVALLNALGIVAQNRLGAGRTPVYTPARPVKSPPPPT